MTTLTDTQKELIIDQINKIESELAELNWVVAKTAQLEGTDICDTSERVTNDLSEKLAEFTNLLF